MTQPHNALFWPHLWNRYCLSPAATATAWHSGEMSTLITTHLTKPAFSSWRPGASPPLRRWRGLVGQTLQRRVREREWETVSARAACKGRQLLEGATERTHTHTMGPCGEDKKAAWQFILNKPSAITGSAGGEYPWREDKAEKNNIYCVLSDYRDPTEEDSSREKTLRCFKERKKKNKKTSSRDSDRHSKYRSGCIWRCYM